MARPEEWEGAARQWPGEPGVYTGEASVGPRARPVLLAIGCGGALLGIRVLGSARACGATGGGTGTGGGGRARHNLVGVLEADGPLRMPGAFEVLATPAPAVGPLAGPGRPRWPEEDWRPPAVALVRAGFPVRGRAETPVYAHGAGYVHGAGFRRALCRCLPGGGCPGCRAGDPPFGLSAPTAFGAPPAGPFHLAPVEPGRWRGFSHWEDPGQEPGLESSWAPGLESSWAPSAGWDPAAVVWVGRPGRRWPANNVLITDADGPTTMLMFPL